MLPPPNQRPSPEQDTRASANPGYAVDQIARAFRALNQDGNGTGRAGERAATWWSVLRGMLSGSITVGSRTPLAEVPAWVTPQVYAGGFATGRFMASGPLRDHEQQWLIAMGKTDLSEPALRAAQKVASVQDAVRSADGWGKRWKAVQAATAAAAEAESAAEPARAALHARLLNDQGFRDLADWLTTGRYRVEVPEEAALLCVAWLALHGYGNEAKQVLDEISPRFHQLRFYPVPAAEPRRATGLCLYTLGEVRARWERMRVPPRVLHQRQVLGTCVPLHDRLISLWLETVDGAAPQQEGHAITGGWPCQRYPEGWPVRAQHLVQELASADCARLGTRWRSGRRGTFPWLAEPLAVAAKTPSSLTGRQVARLRVALAQIGGARGLPGTPRCEALRLAQRQAFEKPDLPRFAAILSQRIASDPADEGLSADRLAQLSAKIHPGEDSNIGGMTLPTALVRKLAQAREGSLTDLVKTGVATSIESLVRAFPIQVARGRAVGWSDPALSRLAAESYLAFARRRSLLLLNLESQVRRLELPWLAAIERHRDREVEARSAAQSILSETALVALRGFPHTILPNRFIREARTLVRDAGLDLPLTEELAADIFMGTFTGQFLAAAQVAGKLLSGSLYARYYGVPYDRIASMRAEGRQHERSTCPELARLCSELAGATSVGRGSPAANGTVIEQQQIITTHNLAVLFATLGLGDQLRAELPDLSRSCYASILDRLERVPSGWVQRLRVVKQAAYAWRQMLFFLSRASAAEQTAFLAWAQAELAKRSERIRVGFSPAVLGLGATLAGQAPHATDPSSPMGIRFLGWTTGRHWLLVGMGLSKPETNRSTSG